MKSDYETIGYSWIIDVWSLLGLKQDLPNWVYTSITLISTYFFLLVPCGFLMDFLDRKLSADLQARVGPSRVGPLGVLQPFVDFLKLLQKAGRKKSSLVIPTWLIIYTMALYSTLAVMPLGSLALLIDTEMSVFLPFWSVLVFALGTMLLGFSQNSVPGWFGGIRIAAQTLAGSFVALISLLCVGMSIGSFRWSLFAKAQGFAPWSWTIFVNPPFQIIAFIIFILSGLVLLSIPPLDGGLSISDLHGGVASHLYGSRLILFRFARFYGFFFWSVITVVLFLGAWSLPEKLQEGFKSIGAKQLLGVLELIWLLIKTFILMLLVIWIARVNPRSRVDQITDFVWIVLSPFAFIALVGTALWTVWSVI